MKHILFCVFIISAYLGKAQVGINTMDLSPGSALQIDSTTGGLVPPRMTEAQMLQIPTPLTGSIVYNTDTGSLWSYRLTRWIDLAQVKIPSIVLNKTYDTGNQLIKTGNNVYSQFPITASDAITDVDPVFFEVVGDGVIQVKQDGVYLITASFSIDNFPGGPHKYIIALFINGTSNGNLKGYLSRGNVTFPTGGNNNEWGTSGVITYPAKRNQKIYLQYVINNDGIPLDAKIMNIAIAKLQ